ncbi:MAG: hypothetical protein Q7R87_03900 [Nanoarchaeota archaeon]|nr:hypothetical protein [Nanoarchaeota archaeon]
MDDIAKYLEKAERKRQKTREIWSENEVYSEAVGQIKASYGLKLSLIERAELRRFIPQVLDARDAISLRGLLEGKHHFEPIGEVVTRFMHDYYNLSWALANVHNSRSDGGVELYTENNAEFKEFLQRLQFRKHNPFVFGENS